MAEPNAFFQQYLNGINPLLVTQRQNLVPSTQPITPPPQGGTQGGAGGAGGNANAGQPGSAGNPGIAKSSADALTGLAMGLGPLGIAGSLMGNIGKQASNSPSILGSLLGLISGGGIAPEGFNAPSQSTIADSAINPAAFGMAPSPATQANAVASPLSQQNFAAAVNAGFDTGAGLGSGVTGTGGGGFGAQVGEQGVAKGLATGTDATGLGPQPGAGVSSGGTSLGGNNPGISGSTGFSGSASTAATGDTAGDVGNQGGGGLGSGGDGGGGDACFAADTQITMGDGSRKAIKDVKPGDEVLSFNGSSLAPKKVLAITSNGLSRKTVRINSTFVTGEHPFQNLTGGWWTARMLTPGDEVQDEQGTVRKIESVDLDAGLHEVYNFEVEDFHTYVADGFRVHNSKAKGGLIKGPAPTSPGKDNVTTTAQGGEYILPRHAVSLIGLKNLEEMRNISNSAAPDHMKHSAIHAVLKRVQNAGTMVRRAPAG